MLEFFSTFLHKSSSFPINIWNTQFEIKTSFKSNTVLNDGQFINQSLVQHYGMEETTYICCICGFDINDVACNRQTPYTGIKLHIIIISILMVDFQLNLG